MPPILDTEIYDEVIRVANDDALDTREQPRSTKACSSGSRPGRPLGSHAGIAGRRTRARIVVIIPSFGERYLSTVLFAGLAD